MMDSKITIDTRPVEQSHGSAADTPRIIEADLKRYRPLYRAALNGDWNFAKELFDRDPHALTAVISIKLWTAAHVAASAGQSEFVEKLVELMPMEALAMKDEQDRTILHYAAMSGSIKAAKAMVEKNRDLSQIMDKDGRTPLEQIIWYNMSKEMVWYLCCVTTDDPPARPFTGRKGLDLSYALTGSGLFDISLYLLQRYPHYAIHILAALTKMPRAFRSGMKLGFWESCIYQVVPVELNYAPPFSLSGDKEDLLKNSRQHADVQSSIKPRSYLIRVLQWFNILIWKTIDCLAPEIKKVRETKLRHELAVELLKQVCIGASEMSSQQIMQFLRELDVLTKAVENGIVEIVIECLQLLPDMLYGSKNGRYPLHYAIENRQEKVYNLMRERTARHKTVLGLLIDGGNPLHLVAKMPPPHRLKLVSGSALQMQRELQWFKEVENAVPPFHREQIKKIEKKKAWEIFMEQHEELAERGEKWMKDTSSSCMVVATLIATIVFAAAFTVPGGNNYDNGIPIFKKRISFMVFVVSDAIALFSSSTSLLMFLSILTARYVQEDFLEALPKRLIMGLASLFVGIAAMMVAFSATLWIVLGNGLISASLPIILVVCFPVTLFAVLQLPLFIEMVRSTYGSGIFCQETSLIL